MTLETIYFVSQTISAIAIIGSLIFVGIQVRLGHRQTEQANSLVRAELTQSTILKCAEFQNGWYETEESAEFMFRALYADAPLSKAEKNRLGIRLAALFNTLQVADMLHRQGLYGQNMYDCLWPIGMAYCEVPRVQKWWRNIGRKVFLMPYQGVIDDMMTRGGAPSDGETDVVVNAAATDL